MGTYIGGHPGGAEINPGLIAEQILNKPNISQAGKKQPSVEAMADKALPRDEIFKKLYGLMPGMEHYAQLKLGKYKADAADIVSQAIAYVMKSIDAKVFRFDTTLANWFKIAVKSRIQDRLRSAARSPLDQAESMDEPMIVSTKGKKNYRQYADPALNPEQQLIAQTNIEQIRKGIGLLAKQNPVMSRVMSLVAEGFTNQEIARRLNLSEEQIKTLKFRGTRALKKMLDGKNRREAKPSSQNARKTNALPR